MLFMMIAATVFLLLAGGYFAVTGREAERNRNAVDRVGRMLAGDVDADVIASILQENKSDLSSMLSDAAQKHAWLRSLNLTLYRAGRPIDLSQLLGLTVALGAACGTLGWLAGYGPWFVALGAAPIMVIRFLKKKRMKLFEEQFPSALALFSRALRAGHAMSSAFTMVGSEMQDPVGSEFALVAREISLGLSAEVALANLQERIDSQDLPVFVTAVLVQLETGGNLAESLDNIGSVIRQRMQFHGKVKALTAQSMMSANVLLVVPFGLFLLMYTQSPGFMEPMVAHPIGSKVLMGAGIMAVVGWLMCRKIADVDA
jgi:tight adherence protein B